MKSIFLEFPGAEYPRLTHFGCTDSSGGTKTGPHLHYGYEMVYFTKGSGTVAVHGNVKPFPVAEEDLLITAPGFLHEFTLSPSTKTVGYYWLGFQAGDTVARGRESSIPPKRIAGRQRVPEVSYVEEIDAGISSITREMNIDSYAVIHRLPEAAMLFSAIGDEVERRRKYAREMIYLKVIELFTLVARRAGDDVPAVDGKMTYLADYIQKNYARPLTLDDLAAASGLAAAYVSRRFKEVHGRSPVIFLTDVRIHEAKKMLRSGSRVVEVAAACGFSDAHYFSMVFRSRTGMTPTVYAAARK
ncbi:MAG: helix-turn-helix transcriptional regulator [Spirochaetes bacterium]|nr:helix-turn-helix transcriptional regulator [Spirochaetota bacterium]